MPRSARVWNEGMVARLWHCAINMRRHLTFCPFMLMITYYRTRRSYCAMSCKYERYVIIS